MVVRMGLRWSERPKVGVRRTGGFTLIEAVIVVAIIGVVAATALPNVSQYFENARGRAAAKSVVDAFHAARAQAIRTGNNHLVFFSIDGAGTRRGPISWRRMAGPCRSWFSTMEPRARRIKIAKSMLKRRR